MKLGLSITLAVAMPWVKTSLRHWGTNSLAVGNLPSEDVQKPAEPFVNEI